jgi:hypothetical protein
VENPFSHTGIVTGTAFCNRKRELADLSGQEFSECASLFLASREIITKNRTYHIQDAMLKKWVQRNITT